MSQFRRSRFTPTPAVGGLLPFGVIKFAFTNQNFAAMSGPSPSLGNFGKILKTVDLGPITEDIVLLMWLASCKSVITSGSGGNAAPVRLLIRDATVKPTASDADFADAANGLNAGVIPPMTFGGVGTKVSDASLLFQTAKTDSWYQANVGIATGAPPNNQDSYGNVMKAGDDIVLDFGVIINPAALPAGTYDAAMWATAMFS